GATEEKRGGRAGGSGDEDAEVLFGSDQHGQDQEGGHQRDSSR
ncbi:unnamed protein product, partial [Tetraodon nigroviridis]